jgi:hypothetical protein
MSGYEMWHDYCDVCGRLSAICKWDGWDNDVAYYGNDICRTCWAETEMVLTTREGGDIEQGGEDENWRGVYACCDRCDDYGLVWSPEKNEGLGWLANNHAFCLGCFTSALVLPDLWGCDYCGVEKLCWKENNWNVCAECYTYDVANDHAEYAANTCTTMAVWEPPTSEMAAPGPSQGPPTTITQAQARKRNLRDQEKLRKWYPNHCTYHLFYHHVLQRPGAWGCTFAKGDDNFCTVGGKQRSHECPDGLAERDLEAFNGE